MFTILENNYTPKEYTKEHLGYECNCSECNSKIRMEKSDVTQRGLTYTRRMVFYCPCCHKESYLKNKKSVRWETTYYK